MNDGTSGGAPNGNPDIRSMTVTDTESPFGCAQPGGAGQNEGSSQLPGSVPVGLENPAQSARSAVPVGVGSSIPIGGADVIHDSIDANRSSVPSAPQPGSSSSCGSGSDFSTGAGTPGSGIVTSPFDSNTTAGSPRSDIDTNSFDREIRSRTEAGSFGSKIDTSSFGSTEAGSYGSGADTGAGSLGSGIGTDTEPGSAQPGSQRLALSPSEEAIHSQPGALPSRGVLLANTAVYLEESKHDVLCEPGAAGDVPMEDDGVGDALGALELEEPGVVAASPSPLSSNALYSPSSSSSGLVPNALYSPSTSSSQAPPKPSKWNCPRCTFENSALLSKCSVCEYDNVDFEAPGASASVPSPRAAHCALANEKMQDDDDDDDVVIPCEKCGVNVPLGLYQLHLNGHKARDGKQRARPPRDVGIPLKPPSAGLQEEEESFTVPCELCSKSIPFELYEVHTKACHNPGPAKQGGKGEDADEIMVPCEFCDEVISGSVYREHMRACRDKLKCPEQQFVAAPVPASAPSATVLPSRGSSATVPCDICHTSVFWIDYERHVAAMHGSRAVPVAAPHAAGNPAGSSSSLDSVSAAPHGAGNPAVGSSSSASSSSSAIIKEDSPNQQPMAIDSDASSSSLSQVEKGSPLVLQPGMLDDREGPHAIDLIKFSENDSKDQDHPMGDARESDGDHEEAPAGEPRIPCEVCGRQVLFSKFEAHADRHRQADRHGDEGEHKGDAEADADIPCERCGTSVRFDQYANHIAMHEKNKALAPSERFDTGDEWIPCDMCDAHFAASEFADHFMAHQTEAEEKRAEKSQKEAKIYLNSQVGVACKILEILRTCPDDIAGQGSCVNFDLATSFVEKFVWMAKNRGLKLAKPKVVYHWTPEKNFDLIIDSNLKVPDGKKLIHQTDTGFYGKGVYTSPDPNYAEGYGHGAARVLCCLSLPGRTHYSTYPQDNGKPCRRGYDTHISNDRSNMEWVFFESSQLLPTFLVEPGYSSQIERVLAQISRMMMSSELVSGLPGAGNANRGDVDWRDLEASQPKPRAKLRNRRFYGRNRGRKKPGGGSFNYMDYD